MVENKQLIPGEVLCASEPISLNAGRIAKTITVTNIGDRPIQVGSHYHFFEVNRALKFDRAEALGFRLDIPAGTAVRFEPGDSKSITLVAIGGSRFIRGLNSLVNGALDATETTNKALEQLQVMGFGDK
ncbi:urease subunit beta [Chroococcidiopsis sp. TS-821]|uniref:urease subunit beta n=1 Tax=Chroococcidiopsis sp. TS-821 TaxID=1378066 RepID=UPI000CEE79E4|nr:urease subunit beta [Chroococcidiopsis sp. TS-821]PPS41906.1 urease subunit beta [Chroococcidiopsis sp. TS-821]